MSERILRDWLPRAWSGVAFGIASMPISACAEAHVKWFAQVDPAETPRPIGAVLTEPVFVELLLLSLISIFLFYYLDRLALRVGLLAELDTRLKRLDRTSAAVMRACGAIFFLSLAVWRWATGNGFLITPELHSDALWLPWLHLAMAAVLVWRRTVPLASIGIFFVYAIAIHEFGWYHLIDYMIFLGIGYFFLVAGVDRGAWRKSGFVVLYASTGLTLTWAAIEKFAYPHWTYPMLAARPGMLMGMDTHDYMVLAGFVEFNLAFVLLGSASTVARLIALGLQSVFVLAIFEFGLLDAIGHLMIIAILFVLFLRGPTDARHMLVLREKALWTEAYFMTGLYTLALVLMFFAYYGLHHLYYE